jgi:hypothetical protein
VARVDEARVVDVDFINAVVLVDAVELSEDSLSELVKLRSAAGLGVPDQIVNLLVDLNVVFA